MKKKLLFSEAHFLSISGWSQSICCINLTLFYFKKKSSIINNLQSLYFNVLSEKHLRKSDILIYISLIHGNRTDYFIFCMNYSKAQICYGIQGYVQHKAPECSAFHLLQHWQGDPIIICYVSHAEGVIDIFDIIQ